MKYIIIGIVFLLAVNASADNDNLEYLRAKLYKCERQKVIDLDDGISSAEIIGKAVTFACEEACLAVGEYGDKKDSFNSNKIRNIYLQYCIDSATKKVLENRVYIKENGVVKIINIDNWQYEYRETKKEKSYSINSFAESTPSYLDISCVDSSNKEEIVSGTTIRLSTVGLHEKLIELGKGDNEFSIIKIKTFFDGKESKIYDDIVWVSRDKKVLIKLGEYIYPFMEKMKKSKILTLYLDASKQPITFNLNGFSNAIKRVSESCKSFYLDKK